MDLAPDMAISAREALRFVLLSGLLSLVSVLAWGRNAPTRRLFMLLAVSAITVLPWLLAAGDMTIALPVAALPEFSLDTALPTWVLGAWLAGAGLCLARTGWRLLQTRRALRRCRPVRDQWLLVRAAELAEQVGVTGPVALRVGLDPCSSTLAPPGWNSQMIVLPDGHGRFDANTMDAVLAHELVHVRHRDDRWMLAMQILVDLHWWMPWLRWLVARYVRAMEEACDDRASAVFADPAAYLDGVVTAARTVVAGPMRHTLPNLGAHHLVARVGRFTLNREQQIDTTGLYWWLVVVTSLVVLATSLRPVLVEPRVSFTVPLSVWSSAPTVDLRVTMLPETGPSAIYPEIISRVRPASPDADPNRVAEPHVRLRPVYPGEAIRDGVEGEVTVAYTVTADGRVARVEVVDSRPAGVFERAVLKALPNVRYPLLEQPLLLQGRPSDAGRREQRFLHTVAFRLPGEP